MRRVDRGRHERAGNHRRNEGRDGVRRLIAPPHGVWFHPGTRRFLRFRAIFVHHRATSAGPRGATLRDALAWDRLAACCCLTHQDVQKPGP